MRKRLVGFVLASSMALTMFPAGALAAELPRPTERSNQTVSAPAMDAVGNEGSYKPYENAAYELKYQENADGTVTITGYAGEAKGQLVLPDAINGKTVTEIGEKAFADCTGLTGNLVLPTGLTTIRDGVFEGCTGLTGELVLPASLTEMEWYAFSRCNGLTSVRTLEGFQKIGEFAFAECSGLESVQFSEDLIMISLGAFYKCTSLTDVFIPKNVVYIDLRAFSDCSALTAFRVDENNPCHTVQDGILYDADKKTLLQCPGGKTGPVNIADTVTKIDSYAFSGCGGLTGEVLLPADISYIGAEAFAGCRGITAFALDENNIDYSVQDGVLYDEAKIRLIQCPGQKTGSLNIPATVSSIEDYAATGCSGLTGELVIPESVTKIGHYAFQDCDGLTSIKIPTDLENIGWGVFSDCDSLMAFVQDGNGQRYGVQDGVLYGMEGRILEQFPGGRTGTANIAETVTLIENEAFGGCRNVTDVHIPARVDCIAANAFKDCDQLRNVYYAGTKRQWQGIQVSDGNVALQNATIYCTDGVLNEKPEIKVGWQSDANGWWYNDANGNYVIGWQHIGENWYYFGDNGYMKTGWQWINGSWFYLNEWGQMAESRWEMIDGTFYYFNEWGQMATNWQYIDGVWYYFNQSGHMLTGWQSINGNWYYFDIHGTMLKDWQHINDSWFYFNESGHMLTGWQQIGGSWYYFNESGYMLTGWQQIGGSWYYFNESGYMLTDWQWIDGNCYYFYSSGAMAANTWIGNSYVNGSGVWVA